MSPAFTTVCGSSTNLFERGDMHEAILMNADIDKRAEVSDVSDAPSESSPAAGRSWFRRHRRKLRGFKFRTRVAAVFPAL